MSMHEFHKFEKDLANLHLVCPKSEGTPRVSCLEEYAGALDRDGNLRDPSELVRDEGSASGIFNLLNQCIIDRPKCILDRIDGIGDRRATPSTDQIVATLRRGRCSRRCTHTETSSGTQDGLNRKVSRPDGLVDVSCIPIRRRTSSVRLKSHYQDNATSGVVGR